MNDIKQIDFSDLSKYRPQLMGVAMTVVVLFHVGGFRHDSLLYCLSRVGNVGVDMFLFLSGMGLWFSWSRLMQGRSRRAWREFYVRRFVRIWPAWLIVAGTYYALQYADGRIGAPRLALQIAFNWGFWADGELTFWYIPTTMAFYLFAPAYMQLIRRNPDWRLLPVAAMLFCVAAHYYAPLRHSIGYLEIMTSRVPIFLLGVNAGLWVMERRRLRPGSFWLVLLVFLLSAFVCVNFEDGLRGRFPLFLERMAYIPLTISMLLLLGRLFASLPPAAGRVFALVGTLSLEIYLIHVQFVLQNIRQHHLGYWLTALAVMAVSVAAAWVVHKIASCVEPLLLQKRGAEKPETK